MAALKPIPIFDGHNDVLLRLHRRAGAEAVECLSARRGQRPSGFAQGAQGRVCRRPVCDLRAVAETRQQLRQPNGTARRRRRHRQRPRAARGRCGGGAADRLCHGRAALPDRARIAGPRSRLPQCRRYRKLPRRRRAGGGAAYRGRRSDRREFRTVGRAPCRGLALARSGLEPAEFVRLRRAVPLPVLARHRARPDRSRQGADRRLQPPADFDRSVASERTRVLGRRRTQHRAAGRHPLQCACHQPAFAQSDRSAIGRDPGNPAAWSASISRLRFCVRTAATTRTRRSS